MIANKRLGFIVGIASTSLIYTVYLILRFGVSIGSCPNPDLTPDFDIAKYMGAWKEFQKTNNILFEEENTCV